jgi:hypothetical protein
MSTYKPTQRWRLKARNWITQYCGGSCQICGYDKYIGNLVFHHLIPSHKTSGVSRLINSTAAWSIILKEADKCVLVCSNCHGEIHAGIIAAPHIDNNKRQEILAKILSEQPLPKTKLFHKCICSKVIQKTNMFCSQECFHKSSEKINWPINLEELVTQSSKRSVAISLGVSDKAVAKRLLRLKASGGTRTRMDYSG